MRSLALGCVVMWTWSDAKQRLARAGGFGTLCAIAVVASLITTGLKQLATAWNRGVSPPPHQGFVLSDVEMDRLLSDLEVSEKEEEAAKAEHDARYFTAVLECVQEKQGKKHYYSIDAPQLECRAEATKEGESHFVERYLKESDSHSQKLLQDLTPRR